ncbi:hypothetical protein GWI33_000632 [Rhynchophorus ferrugineus]|uniref:Uncharacterized protein n=1 Tax=Rhynchophorus ferrugineus TaxID=354439 RepID=A0A834INW1_RHYFE|nr:hypothetical protein GWI33_000632 [Rhynchophorus ferrugineus]
MLVDETLRGCGEGGELAQRCPASPRHGRFDPILSWSSWQPYGIDLAPPIVSRSPAIAGLVCAARSGRVVRFRPWWGVGGDALTETMTSRIEPLGPKVRYRAYFWSGSARWLGDYGDIYLRFRGWRRAEGYFVRGVCVWRGRG